MNHYKARPSPWRGTIDVREDDGAASRKSGPYRSSDKLQRFYRIRSSISLHRARQNMYTISGTMIMP